MRHGNAFSSQLPAEMECLEPRLLLSSEGAGLFSSLIAPLEVQTAATPAVLATIPVAGGVRKVFVSGSLLFAMGDSGVQISSLADPKDPAVLSTYATSSPVTSIVVLGSVAFLGELDGDIETVNIGNPQLPIAVPGGRIAVASGVYNLAYLDSGSGVVNPKRLYAACMSDGLKVIDVTDPTHPAVLGSFTPVGDVRDVAIVGTGSGGWGQNGLAVAAGDMVGLMTVADPNAPAVYSSLTYSTPYDLWTEGFKLDITDAAGLHLVDVGSLAAPQVRGSVAADPTDTLPLLFTTGSSGPLAVLSQIPNGVAIVDVTNPASPAIIGNYSNADARGVWVSGTLMYVACADGTWKVVDTGVVRDLAVSGRPSDSYFAAPGKAFSGHVAIANVGNIASAPNLGLKVSAYLSADGALDASDTLLKSSIIENSSIAAGTSIDRVWAMTVPATTPGGSYYLILKLEGSPSATDSDSANNTWVSPAPIVQIIKGVPPLSFGLAAAGDSGALGDGITNKSPVTVTGVTRPISTVILKKGRTEIARCTSADDGTFSFSNVTLAAGANAFTVTVIDRALNVAALAKIFTYDTVLAAPTFDLAAASDSGIVGDSRTRFPVVTLSGKAEAGAAVSLNLNGDSIATTVASKLGTFSFSNITLADGANSVRIDLADAAANAASTARTITLDQTSPATLYLNARGVAQFHDANNVLVTVVLSGPGTGHLDFPIDWPANIAKIVLTGTTERSSLVIVTTGRGTSTAVGGLDTSGCPLGVLVAPTTTFSGTLNIGPGALPTSGITISVAHFADAVLNSSEGIRALVAKDWHDTDATTDLVQAPWMGVLSISGDFDADLDLSGAASGLTLSKAVVLGDLSHSVWSINGSMGSLVVVRTADHSKVTTTGSMTVISLGASISSDFLAGIDSVCRRHAEVQDANRQDFVNPLASIGTVRIAGWRLARGAPIPRFFEDSNFSAASIGVVSLLDGDFAVGQSGLWALSKPAPAPSPIKLVVHLDLANKANYWLWPARKGIATAPAGFINIL